MKWRTIQIPLHWIHIANNKQMLIPLCNYFHFVNIFFFFLKWKWKWKWTLLWARMGKGRRCDWKKADSSWLHQKLNPLYLVCLSYCLLLISSILISRRVSVLFLCFVVTIVQRELMFSLWEATWYIAIYVCSFIQWAITLLMPVPRPVSSHLLFWYYIWW